MTNELTATPMDALEVYILGNMPLVNMPVKHTYTPGLYSREIFMPAGTILTSKIHKTEHPYIVLDGKVTVCIPGQGLEYLDAGHSGITKPNTKRALYVEEDCRWITFHVLSEEEEKARSEGMKEDKILVMIEERIIEKRDIPGLEGASIHDLYTEMLKEDKEDPEGSVLCHGQL